MIELFEIILIAIVQGIGEFLPISSSGHLAVVNDCFNRFGVPLTQESTDFVKLDVFLHLGTLVAVFIVFKRRILDLFGKDRHLIPLLIIGTLPVVLIGALVKLKMTWITENLVITGIGFFVTGLALLVTLFFVVGDKEASEMTWKDALFIGLFQAVAILPGVSRSGSTIIAGLLRKLKREDAAAFSFLLSIPIIALAGLVELKDILCEPASEKTLSLHLLLLGMLVSCLVGVLALRWLIDWLNKGKLWYFALWVFMMCPVTLFLAMGSAPGTENTSGQYLDTVTETVTNDPLADSSSDSKNDETNRTEPEESDEIPKTPEQESLTRTIENTESSRLNMSQEEALREYEKILAEEEAKEQAFIAEEQKRLPLVEEPEKLVPLDPKDRIWITPDGKSVVLLARVALREGVLELFACRIGTKEHESIVSVRVKPFLIHAALLAIGAEQGKPAQMFPEFVLPTGEEIAIEIRWQDEEGRIQKVPAQDWILDMEKSTKSNKVAMTSNWVFSGSMTYQDEAGENYYTADQTGELVGLSNFVGSILDVPIQSSDSNTELLFGCFTERIPELGTPLTLILTPVKNASR